MNMIRHEQVGVKNEPGFSLYRWAPGGRQAYLAGPEKFPAFDCRVRGYDIRLEEILCGEVAE
jgi:hypothetical protein